MSRKRAGQKKNDHVKTEPVVRIGLRFVKQIKIKNLVKSKKKKIPYISV